jgi:hypothetical protein
MISPEFLADQQNLSDYRKNDQTKEHSTNRKYDAASMTPSIKQNANTTSKMTFI